MDLSVVIPIYNEEKNIESLLEQIYGTVDGFRETFEVIAVNDGSTDSSLEKLKEEKEDRRNLRIIDFRKNFGQSKAIQAGIDKSQGQIIVTIDGDLQNDPKDIPRLVKKLENSDSDVVNGWRKKRKDPLSKKAASKAASVMRRSLFKNSLHDYGCTLKAYNQEAAKSLKLENGMHRYIPPLLVNKGYKVTEIEVNHRPREKGETKYGVKRLPKGFFDMIKIWVTRVFSDRFDAPFNLTKNKSSYRIREVIE